MKRSILIIVLTLSVANALGLAQTGNSSRQTPSAKITASAIWQPAPDFVTKAHAVCDKSAGPASYGSCFLNQIAAAGAPAEAVAFSRMLFQQTNGEVGIMTAFKHYGPVDAAQVFYPLRANTNYGLLLVNGDPAILDVDDLQKLDRAAMEKDAIFQAVKQKYPKIDLWPGDRSGNSPWPRTQPLPDGGTQFVVSYLLLDGCHACAHLGVARFGWGFDAKGKFLRTTYLPTPPPPELMRPRRQPRTPPPTNPPAATPPSTPPSAPPSSPQ